MRELFGVPVQVLAVVLGVLVVVTLGVVAALAVRNRVFFKLGVRNLNRRRGRTAIIVGGLMLGTMIIGSALGFGDVMASTVRTSVITSLGETDEVVSSQAADTRPMMTLGQASGARYLTPAEVAEVTAAARQSPYVDGVAPSISEDVAVQDTSSRQNEPQIRLFAIDPAAMAGFGQIVSTSGDTVDLASLAPSEVLLNGDAVDDLNASVGDRLVVLAGGRQSTLTVSDVVEYDGTGTDGSALLLPLGTAQRVLGAGATVQHVLISNDGGDVDGVQYTDQVVSVLTPVTDRLGLAVEPVKQDGLDQADKEGATYLQMFSTFGTFTISAGVLLIFLVFVMLAAERRGEMGTARAIGTQRRHLVQMFLFEGAAYDVLAAVVGAVLGILVALGMVWAIAGALADTGIVAIRYDVRWSSFVVAFSLGVLLTLAVVLVAAWRVSRLSIVAAVRGLPQPPRRHKSRAWWAVAAGCLAVGGLLVAVGELSNDGSAFLVGGAVVLGASIPVVRALGGSDRLAYSIGGTAVVVWGLLPFGWYKAMAPDLSMGFSVWVLSGLLLVTGATWVVVYNLHALLGAMMWLFGRWPTAAPVVKTAIAQPMRSRFRTGTTIGLFTLVVFTLVTGAATSTSFLAAVNDEETFGGGYDVTAQTSPVSPITDMRRALERAPDVGPGDFTSWGGQSYVPIEARQVGQPSYADYVVRGLDDSFLGHTTYGFAARANGYGSDRQVWQALAQDPTLAVVDAFSVPRRANWGFGSVSDFRLSGFYLEDETFAPVPIQVRDPASGQVLRLKVVGVLADTVPYAMIGVSTSQQALAPLGAAAAPTVWYFQTAPGVDPVTEADRLETAFLDHGMQANAQSEVLQDAVSSSLTFQYLILGFLGLGLVIGVAALGVISARAVVERRQQIGVLRAIGFQSGMVEASFLLESLLVTLLGIVLGTGLGLGIAYNVVVDSASQPGWENLSLEPPWVALVVILAVVIASSLVTTLLPARRASRTYPATALRYE